MHHERFSANTLNEKVITIALIHTSFLTLLLIYFCRVLNNWFLTVAAFLDPRFQIFQNPSDVQSIKEELAKTCDNREATETVSKSQASTSEKTQMTTRKSGKFLVKI